ncbi:hypothetical protein KY285_030927 [Solanum tuberosum]|nr:hypothetical protein KY285_030927 [Solanum tuberosum]
MDFIDGLPKSKGYEVILVVVDRLSKYAHFLPLKHPYTAQSVAEVFMNTMQLLARIVQPTNGPVEHFFNIPSSLWLSIGITLAFIVLFKQLPMGYFMGGSLHYTCHIFLADSHSRVFEVGDWVYHKIHPYKQSTVSGHSFHKLAAKYYGPFQILRKVGPVAYNLCFPDSIKIHPTVHVSLLKSCFALPAHVSLPPVIDIAHPFCPNPESILQRQMVKKGGKTVVQVLVKWEGLSADDSTWEFYQALNVRFPNFDP